MPWPASTRTSPGWVPGGDLELEIAARAPRRARSSRAPRRSSSAAWPCAGRRRRGRSADPGGRGRRRTRCRRSPLRKPAWPSPRTRICWPSWIPAGTSTSSRRSRDDAALRRRSRRTALEHAPAPPQSGQVRCWTNCPKTFCETRRTTPAPPHVGHVRVAVPGSAPVASQRSHGSATSSGTSRDAPVNASSSSISTTTWRSPPRCDALRAPPPPPRRSSPKNAAKTSARLPKSRQPGLEAAAPRPACPEAVVGRAALRDRRAPRTPRRPRESGAPRRAALDTSGCSSRASVRNACLISASLARASRRAPRSSRAP